MKHSITLNRKQINDLVKMATHFSEVETFVIEADNSSGIGAIVNVKFNLFDTKPTTVNITDYESW